MSIAALANAVRNGARTARAVTEESLLRIAARNPSLNAVTRLLEVSARADADAVDALVARGSDPGPLAGIPIAVKDLFALKGLTNTAGSKLHQHAAAETADAEVVRRLKAAGAVVVATTNMDALAYGFVTDNALHGITRNPHDLTRFAGGSSGGSAAAVAAGLVPLSLGSDTNGSIRVPASLCGLYGLRPTFGSLPLTGVFPFVESLDTVGPFARTLDDLELIWQVLAGRAAKSVALPQAAILGGWFARGLDPTMMPHMEQVAALTGAPVVELADAQKARSAAFVMTAVEGGRLHLSDLRDRSDDFDPAVRDRLLAGAALPLSAHHEAAAFQEQFRETLLQLLHRYPVLIAPATPVPAPLIADPTFMLDGERVSARVQLGLYTQPISFAGVPVLSVPLLRPGALPLGLQLIAAPGAEAVLFAFARHLETAGLIGFTPPPTPAVEGK